MDQQEYQDTLNLLLRATRRQGTCTGELSALSDAFHALFQSAIDKGFQVRWEQSTEQWFISQH